MTRQTLPNRRPMITTRVTLGAHSWHISVGFDAHGHAREIFSSGVRVGSDIEALFDDVCVALSLLLQSGYSAAELHKKLGRDGIDPKAQAASPVGMMARVAVTIEASHGPAIARELAAIHGGGGS